MRGDVAHDLTQSADAFVRIVWPAIERIAGGGRLVPVEAVTTDDITRAFDVLAGIDAWQIAGGGIRGIASRVQWGPKAWDTFTIRYERRTGAETEYTKRLRALTEIDRGWLTPHITVQAYINCEELLACGLVRTADLFSFVREYELANGHFPLAGDVRDKRRACYLQQNGGDGNLFIVVPWGFLRENGVDLREVRPEIELVA